MVPSGTSTHDRHLEAWQQGTRLNLHLLILQAFGVGLLRLN